MALTLYYLSHWALVAPIGCTVVSGADTQLENVDLMAQQGSGIPDHVAFPFLGESSWCQNSLLDLAKSVLHNNICRRRGPTGSIMVLVRLGPWILLQTSTGTKKKHAFGTRAAECYGLILGRPFRIC